MEKQTLQPIKKNGVNQFVNVALLAFLATISGCGDKEKAPVPLDVNRVKIETALAQEEKITQINHVILELLQSEETQKQGMQEINIYPHQVNENIVKILIKIAEEERTEKKPEKRSSLVITALGNLTIERAVVEGETEKMQEYIQIKNRIVTCLSDILSEEYKEHLFEDKITKEAQKNDLYKGEVREAIYRAYGRISINPEFLKNDFEFLIKLSKHPDPELKTWALDKTELYKPYRLVFLKEQQGEEKKKE